MPVARIIAAAGALVTSTFCAALFLEVRAPPIQSGWEEIRWPFPRDAWPPGRAFRCRENFCTKGTEVYVRPKIGFCNCTTGVSDDGEVDRVADLDLISERFTPSAPGREVRFAGLPGRARHYTLTMPDGTQRGAVGLAVSQNCDVIVAVVQGQAAAAVEEERNALALLSSDELGRWVRASTE